MLEAKERKPVGKGDYFKQGAKRLQMLPTLGELACPEQPQSWQEAADGHPRTAWHPTGSWRGKGQAQEDGLPAERSRRQSRGRWAPREEPRQKG